MQRTSRGPNPGIPCPPKSLSALHVTLSGFRDSPLGFRGERGLCGKCSDRVLGGGPHQVAEPQALGGPRPWASLLGLRAEKHWVGVWRGWLPQERIWGKDSRAETCPTGLPGGAARSSSAVGGVGGTQGAGGGALTEIAKGGGGGAAGSSWRRRDGNRGLLWLRPLDVPPAPRLPFFGVHHYLWR